MSNVSSHMPVRNTLVIAALIVFAVSVEARPKGCDDSRLPPDQRWNGATSIKTPELARFYAFADEMSAAYKRGAPSTDGLARQYLEAAKRFPCNWNYGNAIHNANAVLGLLALHSGRKAEAVAYLSAAGASPGSPQLDSFGPSLLLARELAEAGEHKAVASYLVSIKSFWRTDDPSVIGMPFPIFRDPDPLSTWIQELNENRVPDFGPFNTRPP